MRPVRNLFLALSLLASSMQASTITFSAIGALNSLPEDASASLTTNDDGTLDITLQDLESNPKSDIENINSFSFILSTVPSAFSVLSSNGTEVTINSDGTYTVGSSVSTGWLLTSLGGAAFEITILGASGPEHTIIGGSSNGTYSAGSYSNANGSIAGSGPHNPFLESGATFVLSLPGVTSATDVSGATFSFGTSTGNELAGSASPEPISVLLIGSGIVLMVLLKRRKIVHVRAVAASRV